MYRYNSYIARTLLHSALLVTFSLTSIVWLTQALRFIDFIVNQGISTRAFLTLTILLIPSLLLMILPVGLFAATLFTYNKLQNDSELVAMEAAGLSLWRLAIPAMTVCSGVVVLAYVISLYLMPISQGRFRDMQAFLRNNYVSLLLQEGVFSSPVEGLTVFVREREKDGTLKGVLVHDSRQELMPITMMAETATLMETPQGPRFLLKNGNRQEMRDGKLSLLNYESYVLDVSLYASQAAGRRIDTREKFLTELFDEAQTAPPALAAELRAEAHQRLVWPIYSIALPMVGLAVLLSGQFNRRGQARRIVMAVLACAVLLIVALVLRAAPADHPAIVLLVYAGAVLPFIWALYLLRESRVRCRTAWGVGT